MDPEDLPSDSDESDEDYCPVKENDSGSEELGSDYDNVENSGDEAAADGKPKRGKKRKGPSKKKWSAKQARVEPNKLEDKELKAESDGEEEDSSKLDALWADFLGGSEDPYSSSKKENTNIPTNSTASSLQDKKISKEPEKPQEPAKVTKIFEFAGEKVEVVQEVKEKEVKKPSTSLPIIPKSSGALKRGVSSILDQIGKKNKISTLEKTKLDWDGFKKEEGLHEELQTHNRGRAGFLERRDFLERTDVRQFEIEKSLRQSKKSAR